MVRFDMYRIRVVAQEQLTMFAAPNKKPQDIQGNRIMTCNFCYLSLLQKCCFFGANALPIFMISC